ncbi:hypothetical protein niasHT_024416 [Heterodera trifolii]|uniref:Transmembrane protein n=1 Tax=Heterodera trifolii TaxID=157864 RepID=A0ABD2JYJ4_9BILA
MLPFCDGLANFTTQNEFLKNLQQINFTGLPNRGSANAKPAVSQFFQQRSYPKFGPPQPTNLKVSFEEAPAEHMVFLFGIFMLISMVIICTMFLMKMTRASGGGGAIASTRAALGAMLPSNYSMVLWMPKTADVKRHYRTPTNHHGRRHSRPSLMLLLRSSFSCANSETARHQRARYAARGRSFVSVVSSSSMHPLLPHSLTITPSPSSGSAGLAGCSSVAVGEGNSIIKIAPPPPYEQFERMEKE